MIVVVSIGGSVLAPDLDSKKFAAYAEAVRKISRNHKVFVVTGGGNAAREYIKVARELGAGEAVCDSIGIEVTRLNARLLIAALGEDAYSEPPKDYQEAKNASFQGIVVMGGVVPGQTTDAVSAILAEYVHADFLINATSVDGVYTSDPKIDKNAVKLANITPRQLVEIVMKTEMTAGSRVPIDPLAAKILERSKIPAIVLDGRDPQNIIDAVEGKHSGTLISEK